MSRLGDAPGIDAEIEPSERSWNCEQIERLYRQALDTVEAVAHDLNSVSESLSTDAESHADADGYAADDDEATSAPDHAALADPSSLGDAGRPNPEQVIEALLFVGGQPLTAKAIGGLLRGDFEATYVERAIDAIGQRYARQNRPYEIRLGEGGYRIVLRPEYEPLRNRVYGFGPKQVRLSQDALEILALVAYRQPLSRQKAEELAKRNVGTALRQLLERGLLVLDSPQGTPPQHSQYRTSPRFLQLFGVARLEDLPQIEDINYK